MGTIACSLLGGIDTQVSFLSPHMPPAGGRILVVFQSLSYFNQLLSNQIFLLGVLVFLQAFNANTTAPAKKKCINRAVPRQPVPWARRARLPRRRILRRRLALWCYTYIRKRANSLSLSLSACMPIQTDVHVDKRHMHACPDRHT